MNLPVFSTADQAYSGVGALARFFNGREPTRTFAATNDDGTLEFASLDPDEAQDARTKQAGVTPFELLSGRVRRNLLMALQRDARYAYASRGRLLLHAAQNNTLRLHDAGRQLELAGA